MAITSRWFDATFSTKPDAAGEIVFAAEGSLRRFAVQLSNQLQALLACHGADGYQALWNDAFPLQAQERLARLIRETKPIRPTQSRQA